MTFDNIKGEPAESAAIPTPDLVEDVPATDEVAGGRAPAVPAVSITPKSPEGTARQRQGRRRGGQRPRHAALVGLGAPLPTLSLRSHTDRMSVLEATLAAASEGRTSGLMAQVIIALVKEARAEATNELEQLAQRQADEIARLRTSVLGR